MIACAAGLLLAAAAGLAMAQSSRHGASTGSLSGKLTDLRSRPVDGATLLLRNATTGSEVTTTTTKHGFYRFSALLPGEYTLQAATPQLGQGQIAGIFVAAGHEAKVQAALALDRQPPEPMVSPSRVRSFSDPASRAPDRSYVTATLSPSLLKPSAEMPATISPTPEAKLISEPIQTLHSNATAPQHPIPQPSPAVTEPHAPTTAMIPHPAPQLGSQISPDLSTTAQVLPPPPARPVLNTAIAARAMPALAGGAINPGTVSGTGLAIARTCAALATVQFALPSSSQILAVSGPVDPAPPASAATLTGDQLQALPLSGRHWENFVLDSPANAVAAQRRADGFSAGV